MRLEGWILGVGLALLGLVPPGVAADEQRSQWEFEFEPYLWGTGNYGSVTAKGRTAKVNVSLSDLWGLLEDGNAFAGMGYASARYDRWSVFADAFGGYAQESVTERVPTQLCTLSVAGTGTMRFAISDFALGYEIGRWSLPARRRPLTLGVYAGARYEYFNVKLKVSGGVAGSVQRAGAAENSWSWADPLIGVRTEVPLFDRVSFAFRGDIGGFGASSKLIWGLVGDVRYWLPWNPYSVQPWLGLGYRVVALDRDFGTNDSIDLQFRGPLGALGLVF
jgi:hypothetical protein